MKIKRLVPTILFIVLLSTFFVGLMVYKDKGVNASSSCPSYMDPNSQACYQYLLDQYNILQKQQGTLENQLSDEQYKQLSLEDKINYINNQVTQSENLIKSLEVEIAAHNVEITLLENDIQEKEDSVSILKQEISVLESTVNQRVTESYKYSFLHPFDLFLDSNSFSTILRKTKYLIATRTQDIASLEDYAQKATALKKEEDNLSIQKSDLQTKQDAIETEKNTLAIQKASLQTQVTEKNNLLAQSKAKSVELLATLRQNKLLQSQYDAQIMAYINAHMGEMIQKGPVAQGSVIGYIYPGGNTCSGSTGAHLHFALSTTSSGTFYANVDLYANGYFGIGQPSGLTPAADGWKFPYLLSGRYIIPIGGGGIYISQDYHDTNGDYIKQASETQYYATDLAKVGGAGNAPVLAVQAGTLSRGVDYCNQGYAIVTHANGYRTIYVHLVK